MMSNARRKELLKVVLMQVEKGNRVPSAILACSSDSGERKDITTAMARCILTSGFDVATYDKVIGFNQEVRRQWVRRAVEKARKAVVKEAHNE